MKHAICTMVFVAVMAAVVSSEIAYGESGTFALGAGTGVQRNVALLSPSALTVSPNPALSQVNFRWTLGVSGATVVKLSIYNVKGELVRAFSSNAAMGQISWNGKNIKGTTLPSGVYIARLTTGKLSLQKNLVICR